MNSTSAITARTEAESIETEPQRLCERCNAPARVWMLRGYVRGEPDMGCLCMACSDAIGGTWKRRAPRRGIDISMFIAYFGVTLAMMTAASDLFDGAHEGFGWLQRFGVAAGSILMVTSAVLRIDLGILTGAVMLACTLGWDVIARTATPGFGWRQQSVLGLALLLAIAGIVARRWPVTAHNESGAS